MAPPIPLTLDDYRIEDEQFAGGANLYYHEVRELLSSESGTAFHSLRDLLADPRGAREALAVSGELGEEGVALCNAGPYAYVYHHLREKLGLRFRIVRDVQAAFHAGYFVQEEACVPMMREGDVVLFPSEYCRQLYLSQFGHLGLGEEGTAVCYPMPWLASVRGLARQDAGTPLADPLIGYLGRVSAEKNVGQLVAAVKLLRKRSSGAPGASGALGRVRLALAGQQEASNSPLCVDVAGFAWASADGRRRSHRDALDLLSSFGVLSFPSTSSMETLGRVVVEAGALRVPVIAAAHAAVPEFVPERATVPVEYIPGYYPLTSASALGMVDEKVLASAIEECLSAPEKWPLPDISRFAGERKRFLAVLAGSARRERPARLSRPVRDFLSGVEIGQRRPSGHAITAERLSALTAEAFARHDYRHIGAVMHEVCSRLGYRPVLRIGE